MFEMREVYVMNGLRITEYVTRFGVERFDIQPWRGEKELRFPVETEDGSWEVRTYPIEIWAAPSRVHVGHESD